MCISNNSAGRATMGTTISATLAANPGSAMCLPSPFATSSRTSATNPTRSGKDGKDGQDGWDLYHTGLYHIREEKEKRFGARRPISPPGIEPGTIRFLRIHYSRMLYQLSYSETGVQQACCCSDGGVGRK
jgi:hypothetical protein